MPTELSTPQKHNSESKTDLAHRILSERIHRGQYMPGYRLVIAPLAEELGVSAVPIREAVRRLEAEGLVTFERNVGAQVTLFNESEYEHTMQTLALLEGFATALAAPCMTPDHFERARATNEQMRETLKLFNPRTFTELNMQFHSILYENCPNPMLLELVQRGWNKLRVIRNSSFTFIPGRALESVNEHDEILEHIERKAPFEEIELLARNHRLATLTAMLEHQQH